MEDENNSFCVCGGFGGCSCPGGDKQHFWTKYYAELEELGYYSADYWYAGLEELDASSIAKTEQIDEAPFGTPPACALPLKEATCMH